MSENHFQGVWEKEIGVKKLITKYTFSKIYIVTLHEISQNPIEKMHKMHDYLIFLHNIKIM